MRGLVHPKIMIERVGVNEDERRSIAGDLVPDVDTVGPAEWHAALRLPPRNASPAGQDLDCIGAGDFGADQFEPG